MNWKKLGLVLLCGSRTPSREANPVRKEFWTTRWKLFPNSLKKFWPLIVFATVVQVFSVGITKRAILLGFTEKNIYMSRVMDWNYSLFPYYAIFGLLLLLLAGTYFRHKLGLHAIVIITFSVFLTDFTSLYLALEGRLVPW